MYRNNSTGPRRRFLPIVRPKALEAIVLQPSVDDPSYFTIHRYEGRTVPCLGPKCLFCDRPMPTENRVFLPGNLVKDGSVVIVDLPFTHIGALNDLATKYLTLRASILRMMRTEPRNNAPIVIQHRPLKDGERVSKPFVDLNGRLDEIFASNCEFALFAVDREKTIFENRSVLTIGGRHES